MNMTFRVEWEAENESMISVPGGLPCVFLLLSTLHGRSQQWPGYQGHKVFRVIPENEEELRFLADFLADNGQKYETWREPTGVSQPVDVQVTPQQLAALTRILSQSGLKHDIIIPDVQSLLESHKTLNKEANSSGTKDTFTKYHELLKIYSWLEDTVSSCPSALRCEVLSIGESYEGRNLPVIKISTAASRPDKTSVWVDAGIHAREWISTSTAMYFIQQLIIGYEVDTAVRSMVENHDWYIMPVINPDGYEYTWTTDRLWRKTRSRNGTSKCIGVDANRNFGFKWNTVAATNDPCSSTFPGWQPFSEPETRAVAEFIMGHSAEWILYLTLHSYSQLWMAPWGYTTDPPHNYRQLYEGGRLAIKALEAVHGTHYATGSAANILYKSSGTSRDWAAGVPQIPFVYTAELRDTGNYGFVLPPNQVLPTAEETWAGLKALVNYIDNDSVDR